MATNNIYIVDTVLLIGTFVTLLILVGYATPQVISDVDSNIQGSSILFSIEDGTSVEISENIQFASSKEYALVEGLTINLDPGIYYFKSNGESIAKIITLTVETTVALTFKKTTTGYNIINSGEKSLDVKIHDTKGIVAQMKLLSESQVKSSEKKQ